MSGPPTNGRERSRGPIAWFVRNRVTANLLFFGISLSGYLALRAVPQEVFPDTSAAGVLVRVALPGAEAAVIEQQILLGLEETLRGIPDVRETSSLAADSAGTVTLLAAAGADSRAIGDAVRERLALASLPADAEEPVITEIAAHREIFRLAVRGGADERSRREAARVVQDALGTVPGVASVERLTGRDYELRIEIPEANLTRFGLTFDRVAASIRAATAEIPGGTLRAGEHELRLRTDGTADFARIPLVAAPDGGVLRVGDLGAVTDGFDATGREAWMDGEPAELYSVGLARDARLQETTDRALAALRELPLPDGFTVHAWISASEIFNSRMELLARNGLSGLVLIFVVLFVCFSSRLAVWTAAGLPVAFFGTFLLMPALDVSMNMISMFGFLLALGVVVDDAIVVGENVQRRLDSGQEGAAEAAIGGARQVMLPVSFGVLTTMAAFLPLFGIPGAAGEMIADVALVVIPLLAFSLVEAAWILPHHLAHGGLRLPSSRHLARVRRACRSGLDWTARALYRPALAWSLANRFATLALGLFSLALAVGLLAGGWIRTLFNPPVEANVITMQVSLPPAATVDATREVARWLDGHLDDVREELRAETGVDVQRHRAVLVGQSLPRGVGGALGGRTARENPSLGEVVLELVPANDRGGIPAAEVVDRIRERVGSAPGEATIAVSANALGDPADLAIRISGPDLVQLRRVAAEFEAWLAAIPGVTSVSNDLQGAAPGLVARVRPDSAGAGIAAAALGRQVRQGFYGEEVQRFQRGRDDVRVLLRSPRDEVDTALGLAAMPVRRPDGVVAPLGEIAEISRESGESLIRRVQGSRAVTVSIDVDESVVFAEAVLARAQDEAFPAFEARFRGARFQVTGAAADAAEGQAALARNTLLAVLLIYALLAIPLGSWGQPFIILAAIPFGLVGAVLGHLVMGINFETMSFFGMAPLAGIVINDALVMLDFMNQRRAGGASAREAALAAGPARFRAVVLTSVTTCAGLAPLLAERSFQAALLIPMAVSLAFGVAFATLVTLFLVPVIYSLTSRRRLAPGVAPPA